MKVKKELIEEIKKVQNIDNLTYEDIVYYTNGFDEVYAQFMFSVFHDNLPFCQSKKQKQLLDKIVLLWKDKHGEYYGSWGEEWQQTDDETMPEWFTSFRRIIEVQEEEIDAPQIEFEDEGISDEEMPTSATDPKFKELCESLIAERKLFEKMNKSLSIKIEDAEDGMKAGRELYKIIKSDYECLQAERDQLRQQVEELKEKLSETQDMSNAIVAQLSQTKFNNGMRAYLMETERKEAVVRRSAKSVIVEMVKCTEFSLNEDNKKMLDDLDNEHLPSGDILINSTKNEHCNQFIAQPVIPTSLENTFTDDDLPF